MAPPNAALRHLALTAAAVAGYYAVNGYTFGFWDHSIHLPWVLREMDPSFLPGDFLIGAAPSHTSLAFVALARLAEVLGLAWACFLLHLACVTLMITGSAALARALFPALPPLALSALAACLVIPSQETWASISSMDDHLLPRGTVGLLLHALALGARGRPHLAYGLVGLVVNIHPTTAAHTAAILWVQQALTGARRKHLITAPLVMVLAAAPLIIHALRGGGVGAVPTPAPSDWAEIANGAFPFHFEIRSVDGHLWVILGAQTACALLAWRHLGGRSLLACGLGVLLVSALGFLGWEVLRLPFARQLHPYESTRFMHYLAMCGAAALMLAWWRDEDAGLHRRLLSLVAASVGLSRYALWAATCAFLTWARTASRVWAALALAAMLPGLWMARREASASGASEPGRAGERRVAALLAGVAAWGGVFAIAIAALGLRSVRIHGERPPSAWACEEHPAEVALEERCGLTLSRWAREALPADAMVAMPPYFFHPLTGFRHRARRGMLTVHKDGGESNFDVAFARAWRERMLALAGLDAAPEVPLAIETEVWTDAAVKPYLEGYRRADDARLRELRRRFGVTHAIVEKGVHVGEIAMPVVYEDAAYRIHRIER